MSKNIHIRNYLERDHEKCLSIIKSNTPLFFSNDEVPQFNRWLFNFEKGVLNSKNATKEFYFVIECQSEILGCGGYTIITETNEIYLTWGMVHRNYQKMGFGAQLLEYRLKSIKENYPTFLICIATTQDIAPFFSKFGFQIKVIKPKFYSETLDRVEMEYLQKT